MEEKLNKLYRECIKELNMVGIDILDEKYYGKIDISIAKRNNKRYGCCRQEEPDKRYKAIIKRGRRKIIRYERFNRHHIEISKWVLELEDNIIKNTIIHEIIHCIPYCNNHGIEFKKYAKLINNAYGYDISRVGDKKKDYEKSNLEYNEGSKYNYRVVCKGCKQEFYRQRINKDFVKKYICGKCKSKFEVVRIK
jgi:hypothetical protein